MIPGASIKFLCTYCGSDPGDPCLTRSGKPYQPHKARLDAAKEVCKVSHNYRLPYDMFKSIEEIRVRHEQGWMRERCPGCQLWKVWVRP